MVRRDRPERVDPKTSLNRVKVGIMPRTLAQVRLKALSGLIEDDCVNNFVFDSHGGLSADYDEIQSDLIAFYDTDPAGTTPSVSAFLSPTIVRDSVVHEINFYDIPEGPYNPQVNPMGPPVAQRKFFLDHAAVGSPLPSEVACALTFHADLTGVPDRIPGGPEGPAGDTRPRQRRTGRVYIGPLNSATVYVEPTNGRTQTSGAFRDALTLAASALKASANHRWCVWSRTDGQLRPVVGGYVDDSFDTQRRRGEAPTFRTTWA